MILRHSVIFRELSQFTKEILTQIFDSANLNLSQYTGWLVYTC